MCKPILLDGGFGTLIWAAAEKAGLPKDPSWKFNISHPEMVLDIHKQYVNAGSQIIYSNTFVANKISIGEGWQKVVESGIEIAKKAGAEKVAADFGPLPVLLAPYGKLGKEECSDIYKELSLLAVKAGADVIVFETFMDLKMMEIAVSAAKAAFTETGVELPIFCSFSFEKRHRTMMGDSIEKMVKTLEPMGISAIGMNCSYGPAEAAEIIKEFVEYARIPLIVKPNAGTGESLSKEEYAAALMPALGLVKYAGGCCGTNPGYIEEIKKCITDLQ